MNKARFILACLLTILNSQHARAYDAETHGLIMYAAYARSSLTGTGPGSVVGVLGLDRLDTHLPFNAYWLDPAEEPSYLDGTYVPQGSLIYRHPSEYERCQMQHIAPWMPNSEPMLLGNSDPNIPSVVLYLPIQNWLLRGVMREDDLNGIGNLFAGTGCLGATPDPSPHGDIERVFNHFYDPINDRPLTTSIPLGKKSVDWALGYLDSFALQLSVDTFRDNNFSYLDAREHEWRALTWEYVPYLPYSSQMRSDDGKLRQYEWATTFRALGDVVHLLQDGAQPQHVRNDAHSPTPNVSTERQAYEGYTNARVWPAANVNAYVRGFFGGDPQIPTIVLGLGYPKPMFATPVRFFSTRADGDGPMVLPDDRLGLMDYTNRGFFTGGTLPGMSGDEFLEPPSEIDVSAGYVQSAVPCLLSTELAGRFQISCVHWMRWPWDSFAAGYVDELPHQDRQPSPFSAPPVLTQSVYNEIADTFGATAFPRFAVGLEEFQSMANLTIPRAIAYSAGFLDYFFRGSISLSSPPAGLISVVDQGIDHTTLQGVPILNDGSNKTFGFTTVRVRARNSTLDITDADPAVGVVPQTMTSGNLVAIARYHRNPCYQPDLSGEFVKKPDGTTTVPNGCSVADTRSSNPEISVSLPIPIDGNGNLPATNNGANACANVGNINTGVGSGSCSNDNALFEFDFSNDPIPINATDVFLQVAYRGQLGRELDGIAVGAMDISEPNYYSIWNNTDYFLYFGNHVLPSQVPPPYSEPATDTTAEQFCFGDELIMSLGYGQVLHSGWDFLRVAVLSTTDPHAVIGYTVTIPGIGVINNGHGSKANVKRQAESEDGRGFDPDPMEYGRGITIGTDFDAVQFFYPTTVENSSVLALPPLLTAPRGEGLADQGVLQFTSSPQTPCSSP